MVTPCCWATEMPLAEFLGDLKPRFGEVTLTLPLTLIIPNHCPTSQSCLWPYYCCGVCAAWCRIHGSQVLTLTYYVRSATGSKLRRFPGESSYERQVAASAPRVRASMHPRVRASARPRFRGSARPRVRKCARPEVRASASPRVRVSMCVRESTCPRARVSARARVRVSLRRVSALARIRAVSASWQYPRSEGTKELHAHPRGAQCKFETFSKGDPEAPTRD